MFTASCCLLLVAHASAIGGQISPNPILLQSDSYYENSQPGIQAESGTISFLVADKNVPYEDIIRDLVKDKVAVKVKAVLLILLKLALKVVVKVLIVGAAIVAVIASLISLAVGFTNMICQYTSLCSIKLIEHVWPNKHFVEAVGEYMTPERLTALSNFVLDALEKYSQQQGRKH